VLDANHVSLPRTHVDGFSELRNSGFAALFLVGARGKIGCWGHEKPGERIEIGGRDVGVGSARVTGAAERGCVTEAVRRASCVFNRMPISAVLENSARNRTSEIPPTPAPLRATWRLTRLIQTLLQPATPTPAPEKETKGKKTSPLNQSFLAGRKSAVSSESRAPRKPLTGEQWMGLMS
jgi:hypothetical protein